jgi:hypothetical protein
MDFDNIAATQSDPFAEAEASLYHQSSKTHYKVHKFPFLMGREENDQPVDLLLKDSNRSNLQQYCSRKHASIIKNGNNYELHSHGKNGTAILRDSNTIIIPIGEYDVLKNGDGIKLGFLLDSSYREFIFVWSINKSLSDDKEIKCLICGDFFEFSTREQVFYQSKGFKDPSRCQSCRIAKKRVSEDGITADNNSKPTQKKKKSRRSGKK